MSFAVNAAALVFVIVLSFNDKMLYYVIIR